MYKLLHICTYLYLFSISVIQAIQTANSRSLQNFLDSPKSNQFLNKNHYRNRRGNSGWFEEAKAGNYERECVEDKCSYEELSEIISDEGALEQAWKTLTRNCEIAPLCSAEGTAICVQTWKKKDCVCKSGWTGELCDTDVDECDVITDVCGDLGQTCANFNGGFECVCQNGFESVGGLDTDEGLTCEDIDECAQGIHGCTDHNDEIDGSLCENTVGRWNCRDTVVTETRADVTTVAPLGQLQEEDEMPEDVMPDDYEDGSGTTIISITEPGTAPPETTTETATETATVTTTEQAPTTTEKVNKYVNKHCGAANICNHNDGKGGCDHICVPLCDEDCDCSYQCKCNSGYALSCDYKSCVAI